MKDWEIIGDNLSEAGWTWGCVASVDREGRTIWVVAAERNAQRFIVRAEEKLSAFMELESAIRGCGFLARQAGEIFSRLGVVNGSESGGGHFPARFFAPSGPAIPESTLAGKRKEEL
jgi:hypothetical protein